MKRFILGTAGHIDHGKTALVRALTGTDTDRLPEEKARGITIDLGFAHLERGDVRVGFVDVPGHERFVRNMLAGAGGVDAVLLVVAADESVMPQTREHFEIVRLLGVSRGLVALTKSDLAGPDLLAIARAEVEDLVRGSFLEKAPILPVSARSGSGVEALASAIMGLAEAPTEGDRRLGLLRLPIDRAFGMSGFGPVVTGSLVSGRIAREQRVEILPERIAARVRRIEVHGHETAEAFAGERTSVNLAGVEQESLARGQMIASPGEIDLSSSLLVRLEALTTAAAMKTGDRFRFFHYAREINARLRLLGARTLAPGATGLARLILSEPVPALPGDRFVLRRLSPVSTVGGGGVLDALPVGHREREFRPEEAAALEGADLGGRLMIRVERAGPFGALDTELARRSGRSVAEIHAALVSRLRSSELLIVRRDPDRYLSLPAFAGLERAARELLEQNARQQKTSVGMGRSALLGRLGFETDARLGEAILQLLASRRVVELAAEEVRLPGRTDLAPTESALATRIGAVFRDRGLDPPSPGEVAASVGHKPKVVEGLIGYLVKTGVLVRLPGGFVIAREAVDQVASRLRARGGSRFSVPQFKEMFGLTRRLAIPLLEYLDGQKVTRRIGDEREVARGGA